MLPIYLDYNATTPIDPRVRAAMLPFLGENFGNPSSSHAFGVGAREAIEIARGHLANLIDAEPEEIVFNGGGTEASNHAIKGIVFNHPADAHVILSAIEHPATSAPCEFLKKLGCSLTVVPVDRFGMVDPDEVRRAITPSTRLISIMHSNNEVGTLQPIREITKIAHAQGIVMHTDAAQSIGKVNVSVRDLGVDLLTIAGHKLYAPKGVGGLFVRRGVKLENLIHGAGHERGRRAGTENVPYLVGLGKAAELAADAFPGETDRLRHLRDRLHNQLEQELGERIVLNGHPEQRLPNTLNVNFVGSVGAELLQRVPEVAASTGSACHEGHVSLSPVLRAMNVESKLGAGAVRLSVGRFTTEEEVDSATQALVRGARLGWQTHHPTAT